MNEEAFNPDNMVSDDEWMPKDERTPTQKVCEHSWEFFMHTGNRCEMYKCVKCKITDTQPLLRVVRGTI